MNKNFYKSCPFAQRLYLFCFCLFCIILILTAHEPTCPTAGRVREQEPQRCGCVLLPLPQTGCIPAQLWHVCRVFGPVPQGLRWVKSDVDVNQPDVQKGLPLTWVGVSRSSVLWFLVRPHQGLDQWDGHSRWYAAHHVWGDVAGKADSPPSGGFSSPTLRLYV